MKQNYPLKKIQTRLFPFSSPRSIPKCHLTRIRGKIEGYFVWKDVQNDACKWPGRRCPHVKRRDRNWDERHFLAVTSSLRTSDMMRKTVQLNVMQRLEMSPGDRWTVVHTVFRYKQSWTTWRKNFFYATGMICLFSPTSQLAMQQLRKKAQSSLWLTRAYFAHRPSD